MRRDPFKVLKYLLVVLLIILLAMLVITIMAVRAAAYTTQWMILFLFLPL